MSLNNISERLRPLIAPVLFITILGLSIALIALLNQPRYLDFDENLVQTIKNAAMVSEYDQTVETEVIVEGRRLVITGRYYIDRTKGMFLSEATTTISIPHGLPGSGDHSFTHENLSTGNYVYVRIQTTSEFLKSTIQNSSEWRRFAIGEIPAAYKNVAVPGPLFDALAIFAENGKYLRLIAKDPEPSRHDNVSRYTFEFISSDTLGGFLAALAPRIGDTGTVEAYVLNDTHLLERVIITGPNYRSEAAINAHPAPRIIDLPS